MIMNTERIREYCRHEIICIHCRGEFTIGNETYSVEPIDETLTGRHRVYKESDNLLSTQTCGTYSSLSYRRPDAIVVEVKPFWFFLPFLPTMNHVFAYGSAVMVNHG